jgi:hypothetical protein
MERIGEIFKSYRNRKKITQKEFGIILGYSETTIKKIEAKKNSYNPSEKLLNKFLSQKGITKEEKEFIKNYKKNTSERKEEINKEDKYSYEDELKIKAFLSEYSTTNRLVKVMWDFREILFKYFQEIDLLLSTNEFKTNKKMEKGILKVSEDLDDMSKKMKKHLDKKMIDAQIL